MLDTEADSAVVPENSLDEANSAPEIVGALQEKIFLLDTQLMPIIAANAGVRAKCEWMGGSVVTLSEAIKGYPKELVDEDFSVLMSRVYDFIVNQELQTDEIEEDEAEKEVSTQEDKSKDQNDNKAAEKAQTSTNHNEDSKKSDDVAEHSEQSSVQVTTAVTVERNLESSSVRQVDADTTEKRGRQTISSPESETTKTPINESVEKVSTGRDKPDAEEEREVSTRKTTGDLVEIQAAENNLDATPEATTRKQEAAAEVEEAEIKTEVEGNESNNPVPQVALYEETLAPTPAKQENLDSELTESFSEEETYVDVDEVFEQTDILIAEDENQAEISLEQQMGAISLDGLVDVEFQNLYTNEEDPEVGETFDLRLNHEFSTFEASEEVSDAEQTIQISSQVEEIENTLNKLTELIESDKVQETEVVNEILDKILEVPTKLHAPESEYVSEAEAQEELEELFIELFEAANIEYSPEIVESLVRLTLNWRLVKEIKSLKKEQESGDEPHEVGTHEIIKQLLIGLGTIKKAITHAYTIGKSAIRLYSVSFAT